MRRVLTVLETVGGICHVLFFVVIVINLATLGERSSAAWVFGKIISEASGWNKGISFHLGTTLMFIPLAGYDSVLHMSLSSLLAFFQEQTTNLCTVDEIKEPRKESQSQ